jgi:hypothetical protein
MGRCSHVSWPRVLLVTCIAVVAFLLVWFIRCLIRVYEDDRPSSEAVWSADWCDVVAGCALFILSAIAGIIIACTGAQHVLLVTSDPKLLSAPMPSHVTPIRQWTHQVHPTTEKKPSALDMPSPTRYPVQQTPNFPRKKLPRDPATSDILKSVPYPVQQTHNLPRAKLARATDYPDPFAPLWT